jgi:hypothetical protein
MTRYKSGKTPSILNTIDTKISPLKKIIACKSSGAFSLKTKEIRLYKTKGIYKYNNVLDIRASII